MSHKDMIGLLAYQIIPFEIIIPTYIVIAAL